MGRCDAPRKSPGQGFLLNAPMPGDAVPTLLEVGGRSGLLVEG